MKVSLNIVEKLLGFALPPVDEVVARVNAQLGGVEEQTNLDEKYAGARIVRVVECEKHPNADRLSVTKIDDGGVVADVPRDENGLVQVVCGAPNVHADMWAVWLPPKTAVPASFDEGEPFVLDARPLRGVLSQGMLAAGDELALNDDHEGIIEITQQDMPKDTQLMAGAAFAETFGLTGQVIDIENKMFTHRPDGFGQLGVAREIAGIFGKQFTSPEWYTAVQEFGDATGIELTVANDALQVVPRFMAVAIKDVTVAPSPLWLQCQLVAMGGKPINNIVDATNYIMLMTAQPTHAYDYDTLRGNQLRVRMAREGETLDLLSGKTISLAADDIVITDAEGPIGLAGIMGGSATEVSAKTKNIVLEVATFDMYAVRKTAMRHGIFTDALTRFNKGQSPMQTAPVLQKLIEMVGGHQASAVYDEGPAHTQPVVDGRYRAEGLTITRQFVNERLGTDFSNQDITEILERTEFSVQTNEQDLTVLVPFWRTDIEQPEDIVEEVGRLYGFDKLPRELPRRSTKPAPKNSRRALKQAVRTSLSRAGANEVLTYSFVHENILKKAEQSLQDAYKLSNALSPDLQYYRLTVLPSLLDKVHMNIKAGHDEFALFEMGKGHIKPHGTGEDGLPEASQFTDIVYAAKKSRDGAPFYRMRRLVEQLAHDLGCELAFTSIEQALDIPTAAPFDQARSAVVETADGRYIGIVGELKQSVIKQFKLPHYVAAATLDTAELEQAYNRSRKTYHPLSRFPSTAQDISLKLPVTVSYQQAFSSVTKAVRAIDIAVDIQVLPVSIYQPGDHEQVKTITFRIQVTPQEETLTGKSVGNLVKRIADEVCAETGAILA